MQLAPQYSPTVKSRPAELSPASDAQTTELKRAGGQGETSRPIKVCFISPLGYGLYRPESGLSFGGAEVQFYLLACALSKEQGFSVSVLTTVDELPSVEQQGPLTLFTRRGQKRLGAGQSAGHPFKTLWGYGSAFLDMLKQLRTIDADLYLHAGAGVEVGAYALICRLLRRRFLYVVASSADLCDPNGKVEGPLKGLYPLGLRLAHAVACRTREQQKWLKARYGRDGVLIRTAYPLPSSHASRLTPHAKCTVLWVGRAHPLKQPELFLDLARRLPQERCVMVLMKDAVHEDLLAAIKARAASLPNLTIREDLPLSEVDRLMGQAKLFINTSTYEGFPNTFVQAAMRGVPIMSLTVDPDGVLSRHGIGLCAGGSFERLVEASGHVCVSEPLWKNLSVRAQVYAREHHDLDRSLRELKQLLYAMAGPSRRRAA